MHSLQTSAAAIPAALSPCGSAAAAASAAAFLAAPAISTPVTSARALADQTGAVEDARRAGCAGRGRRSRAPAPPSRRRPRGRGPGRRGRRSPGRAPARRRTRPEAGRVARSGPWSAAASPSGRRSGRRSRRPPAAASSEGIARQIEVEAGELDLRCLPHVEPSPAATRPPGSAGFRPPRSISAACSAVRVPSWTSRPPRASRTATAVPQLPAPITAARRIGGSPPRSSHCSSTLGQIRAVTVSASAARGILGAREGHRLAEPDLDLAGTDAPAAAHVFGAEHGGRDDRGAGLQREPPDTALGLAQGAAADPGALGEDADGAAAFDQQPRRLHRLLVGLAAADREGAEAARGSSPASGARRARPWRRSSSAAARAGQPPIAKGSRKLRWLAATIRPPLSRACSRPVRDVAEVDEEERGHEDPGERGRGSAS